MMILNIVQDLDQKSGGVPKVAGVVAGLLQNRGYEAQTKQTRKYSPNLRLDFGVNIASAAFGVTSIAFTLLRSKFWPQIKPVNPPILIFHGVWTPEFWFLALICRVLQFKYLIFVHGMLDQHSLKHSAKKKNIARKLIVNGFLRRSNFLIAGSQGEIDAWPRDLLLRNIKIVPNSIASIHPKTLVAPQGNAMVLQALKAKRVICFMGRTTAKKGLEILIDAFAHSVNKFRHETVLLLLGMKESEKYENLILKKIRCSSARDSIFYTNTITGNHAKYVLSRSSLFALLSDHEGLPIALLEALSMGIPSIISDNCNICLDESSGGQVVAGETYELAKALIYFCDMSDAQLRELGHKAQSFFQANFSAETVSVLLASIVEQLEDYG